MWAKARQRSDRCAVAGRYSAGTRGGTWALVGERGVVAGSRGLSWPGPPPTNTTDALTAGPYELEGEDATGTAVPWLYRPKYRQRTGFGSFFVDPVPRLPQAPNTHSLSIAQHSTAQHTSAHTAQAQASIDIRAWPWDGHP